MARCTLCKTDKSELPSKTNCISTLDGNADFRRSLSMYPEEEKSRSHKFDVGRMNRRSKYFECDRSFTCLNSARNRLANDRFCGLASWLFVYVRHLQVLYGSALDEAQKHFLNELDLRHRTSKKQD